GISIDARGRRADFADPKKLKDPDPKKPIADWIKIAILARLRKPGTVYDSVPTRKFLVKLPKPDGSPGTTDSRELEEFPRKLGRRMDYVAGPDKGRFYEFPT